MKVIRMKTWNILKRTLAVMPVLLFFSCQPSGTIVVPSFAVPVSVLIGTGAMAGALSIAYFQRFRKLLREF
jgi:hypothetical protein